jgi:thioesterase domain-containing protein
MVPARYQWVESMPLTPSGKRDDAALRALGSSGLDTTGPSGDELQDSIAALLADFAGVDDLGADTSFFDAGGTSIGATRAAMTIARRWDVELPLQTFIAAPTARELADLVRSHDTHRGFDPVVTLREAGDEPPLFLVHPIGGNVLCYRALADRLPGDRAVYGLQAAGAEPGTTALTSMETLATSYLEAIRRVHPSGPLHLAGWSFGGYVAVEMARQVGDVASLTLLDTIALTDGPRPVLDENQLIVLFFRELLWSSAGSSTVDDTGIDPATAEPGELFDAVFRRTVELGILPADGSPRLLRRLYEVFRANYQATVDYRIGRVHQRMLVLQASEELPTGLADAHRTAGSMFDSPSNGWQHWAGHPVETIPVPGNHLSMMVAPQVDVLAGELGDALARADAGDRVEAGVAS